MMGEPIIVEGHAGDELLDVLATFADTVEARAAAQAAAEEDAA